MKTKRITAKVERTARNGFSASLADRRYIPKVVPSKAVYRRKPRTQRDSREAT
jgi:hypothetical protein